jgi:hypothetical protein
MRYNISSQTKYPTRIKQIGFGDAVTTNTMVMMKDIINLSLKNYYIRRWAEKIIDGITNDEDKVYTIYDFIYKNTKYLYDPYGLELLKSPEVALELIEVGEIPALDCDDLTILSLSLLKSVGFPVALRTAGYRLEEPYSHVYGLVMVKKKWIPIDLVKGQGPGWEPPGKIMVRDMEV